MMTGIEKAWVTEEGYTAFVVHHYRNSSNGWRCGYVGVPKGHPLFGCAYNRSADALKGQILQVCVEVGCEGLTFSGPGSFFANGFELPDVMPCGWAELWFFGFDFLYEDVGIEDVIEDCKRLSAWLKSVEKRKMM